MTRYISRSLAGTKTYGGRRGRNGIYRVEKTREVLFSLSSAPPSSSSGRCSNLVAVLQLVEDNSLLVASSYSRGVSGVSSGQSLSSLRASERKGGAAGR
ncbi:hypothetical protein NPIL_253811 [Nephila pilipes]|uniref:Uncharacterized protein n=1 Tax=Nephila pilipes TaxID=299642 RepID=A0A8X6MVF8_NEPPI|nr:hypothetical protein NPIL_253811 [Nephila pilipes]